MIIKKQLCRWKLILKFYYVTILGGTRRVVLLLPDGNLMMTEVTEEQYAALGLGKWRDT